MKKMLLTAATGLAVIAAPIAASAQPYGYGQNDSRGYHSQSRGYGQDRAGWDGRDRGERNNGGALLAAGLFGLVLGAIVSNAANSQQASYAAPDDGYGYGPQCGWQTEAYRNAWGQLEYQQVQVCR